MAQRKPPTELFHVDRQLWRTCAGALVHPPTLNSIVYYFPQGHLEQASSPVPTLSPSAAGHSVLLCRVSSVQLLVDDHTDEVFCKLLLHPIHPSEETPALVNRDGDKEDDDNDGNIDSYAKVLTPSDANNGGGFSVPRFCADSIFPKLDYNVEPPLQTLVVKDLHGTVWKFRHIYRGTPRRHLLTTGWSRFVNCKKLIAGDSVVFMKKTTGDVLVGIRRVARANVSVEFAQWREEIGGGRFGGEGVGESNQGLAFGSGRVSAESVVQAIERAVQGMDFEVVYYPKAPWSDFVVKIEVAEKAFKNSWGPGVKVKMNMETEDLSRLTSLLGTVQCVSVPSLPWFGSPWRMLQVSWDGPEVSHFPPKVNPWEVEFMGPTAPIIGSTSPPSRKRRLSQSFPDGEPEVLVPKSGLNNSPTNQSNSSLLGCNSIPAGMQGARHSSFHLSSISNTASGSTLNMCSDNSLGKKMIPKLGSLSTELNTGSSLSADLSPSSQSSVQSTAEENSGKGDESTKVFVNSIQLFGQIIYFGPIRSPDVFHAEDEVAKKHAKNGDSGITVDLSLTSPLADKTN